MKGLLILFLVGVSFQSAFAAKPANFYCSEAVINQENENTENGPRGVPVIFSFDKTQKSCDGKASYREFVCQETVKCLWVDVDIKKAAKEKYHTDYAKLNSDQKKALLGLKVEADGIPTLLVCPGKNNGGDRTICPLPEKCKTDIFYNPHKAQFAKDDKEANIKRVVGDRDPNTFETNPDETPEGTTSGTAEVPVQ